MDKPKVNLMLLSDKDIKMSWSLGEVFLAAKSIMSVDKLLKEKLDLKASDAWLFWDPELGKPNEAYVEALLIKPIDVCHAGLKLGMKGLPRAIDYVVPTWMLNCDPPEDIEATSWRISPRACLIRTEVIKKMGWFSPGFKSIEAAFLEMGHRWVLRGVLMRHVPQLIELTSKSKNQKLGISFDDEIRFIYYRFGKKWAMWSLCRSIMTGILDPFRGLETFFQITKQALPKEPKPYRDSRDSSAIRSEDNRKEQKVSVIIPTINRYAYLKVLLGQLKNQTIPPYEIIISDQTPIHERVTGFYDAFKDLPLKIRFLEKAGQCLARNIALKEMTGEVALFLDDDDEIQPDLIERHLKNLAHFKCTVSSGVAIEAGAGRLPENFQLLRQSDVFPTNNTLIQKDVLKRSGVFDLAYDRGSRADADLGMRIYLSGALMLLDPQISVLHHHAAQGGLRTHKARAVTYAASRSKLFIRHLPSVTEIYLCKRYFSPKQVKEKLWLSVLGTFSMRGNGCHKILKGIISYLLLPHTIWKITFNTQKAAEMLKTYPKIPTFQSAEATFSSHS